VVLRWPDVPVTDTELRLRGARHVHCIGGAFHPAGTTTRQGALEFLDCRGTIHLERMVIDLADRQQRGIPYPSNGDAVAWGGAAGAPPAAFPDLVLQRCRIVNVRGRHAHPGWHADMVQQRGPCGNVWVVDVTGSTNYHGLLWVPLTRSVWTPTYKGAAWRIRNLNLHVLPQAPGDVCEPFYMKSGPDVARSQVFDLRFDGPNGVYLAVDRVPAAWASHRGHGVGAHWHRAFVHPPGGWYGARRLDARTAMLPTVSGSWEVGWADTPLALNAAGGYPTADDGDAFARTLARAGVGRGRLHLGRPPGGDFCPPALAGPASPPLHAPG
jgi:hypothetical protein